MIPDQATSIAPGMKRPLPRKANELEFLKDVIQWEVRNWSRALPFWEDHIPSNRPLKALGIGEREGGLSLWFAMRSIDVVCSDLNDLPGTTKELHQRYDPPGTIGYARADVTSLPFDDATFDLVFFKSVIGALGIKDRQLAAMHEIHRVLRPGGRLFFAENLQGTRAHIWLRRRFVAWNTYWRYLHPVKDRDLFDRFDRSYFRAIGVAANLGRNEAQRDLLARADRVLERIIPHTWREIWIGVAIK